MALVLSGKALLAEEDDHYIQPDDYFISKEAFKAQSWIYVYLAKMATPASVKTKNEAEFLQVMDGKKTWTKNYWPTRIAAEADLKIGVEVIILEVAGEEDIYRAPNSKEEARTTSWFMAKITDISDLYKGYVTVSGGYKVSVKGLRVAVNKQKIKAD